MPPQTVDATQALNLSIVIDSLPQIVLNTVNYSRIHHLFRKYHQNPGDGVSNAWHIGVQVVAVLFASGRLQFTDGQTCLDGTKLG